MKYAAFLHVVLAIHGCTPAVDEDVEDDCVAPCTGHRTAPEGDTDTTTTPTDPLLDSDGDGYLDEDELYEGTDPFDYESRIYTGFWPYYRDKTSMDQVPLDGSPVVSGEQFPHLRAIDQFGDVVDLYDYGGQQSFTSMVIMAGVMWASPEHDISSWLAGADDPRGLEDDYGPLRQAVSTGEHAWVMVFAENASSLSPSPVDVQDWHAEYPNSKVAVLADPDWVEDAVIGIPIVYPGGVLIRTSDMEVIEVGTIYEMMDLALFQL